ncbi:MAG: hypothetical protein E3J72_12840 [Planctomycetota bacterium]|nr:MAG: hypothetical protein E3J72_12840 [Planctomycetota bacterium]
MKKKYVILCLLAAFLTIYYLSAPAMAMESPDANVRVDLPETPDQKILPPDESIAVDLEFTPEGNQPPIEFFETPIRTEKVVFVTDRSGSMRRPFLGFVTDLEGNQVFNVTKLEAVNLELKRAIMSLSDNVSFNITYFESSWISWKTEIVPASEQNKAAAFAWIDMNGHPCGGTNIAEPVVSGGFAYEPDTLILLSDGAPIAVSGPACDEVTGGHGSGRPPDMESGETSTSYWTKKIIRKKNTDNVRIHTFFISSGDCRYDEQCRRLMQTIALQNGPGTFTEIGR